MSNASADWSMMLDSTAGGAAGSGLGRIVTGVQDVEQCIAIILSTLPGEDALRPTFGVDLMRFVDMPLNAAIPAIVAAVTDAIEEFEPRVTLQGVTVAPDSTNPGHVTINVTWTLALGAVVAPVRSTSVAVALSTGVA
jgi:phage baseplate assembly protein W